MKIRFTVPDSVNAKLKGYISRGIAALEVNDEGHLIITLTDGAVEDLGKVSGDDGVSCTHEWDGTVLRVTSASGTSSADLKGDKGDTGERGERGERGFQGERGEKGDCGVYVGDEESQDDGILVWFTDDGEVDAVFAEIVARLDDITERLEALERGGGGSGGDDDTDSTSAVLGVAVLGRMKLGRK